MLHMSIKTISLHGSFGGTSKNLCLGIDVSEPKKEELDIYYSM